MIFYNRDHWGFIKKSLSLFISTMAFAITIYTIHNSALIDFEIYYEAGRSLINGESPYRFYGSFSLPFQYFPWISWLFAALAMLPMREAWIIYATINIGIFYCSIVLLLRLLDEEKNAAQSSIPLLAASLMMSLLVFVVGQISILILFFCVLVMKLLIHGENAKAGLLMPFLLVKPHLVLIFLLQACRKGGRSFIMSSIASTAFLLFVSTLLNQHWFSEMLDVFQIGQTNRGNQLLWGFSTPAGALGLQNWRVANFYLSLPSLLVAIFAIWKMKELSLFPQLAFALALSLFSAPYSFSYDFPLLVPALVYITSRFKNYAIPIWGFSAILPTFFQFQGQSYWLILVIAILIFVIIINTPGKEQ